MTRYRFHRLQHTAVANATCLNLLIHHSRPIAIEVILKCNDWLCGADKNNCCEYKTNREHIANLTLQWLLCTAQAFCEELHPTTEFDCPPLVLPSESKRTTG